jgi:hypothetical protein
MQRLAAMAALFVGTAAIGWSAQIPMLEEPRHQQVLYIAHMRVFDVNVPPGDTTLDHVHDYDLATLTLGNATTRTLQPGQDWSAPRVRERGHVAVTEYTGTPAVHRVENVDTIPYRVLAITNLRDDGWTTPAAIAAPGTTLSQQSRAFSVYDVRLDAATAETTHVHEVPTLAVLVSGLYEYRGDGGEVPFVVRDIGRWIVTRGGQHTLARTGGNDAHIVEFEAR